MDLFSKVTVFVITVGEPSTERCIEMIRSQDCRATIEIIDHVAPMDVAFQQMIDRCTTPYYVQVDADMLLAPRAIRTLYAAIESAGEKVAEVVGWLWGDAEERPIQGVKIYRHSITKSFPYSSSFSCEMPVVQAIKNAGHEIKALPEPVQRQDCLGLHYSLQTPQMAYGRWKRLMQKFRRYPWMGWLAPYPEILRRRAQTNPSEINSAAYVGLIAGLSGDLQSNEEQDFRSSCCDFRRIMQNQGPLELILYATEKCNFKCNFCLRQRRDSIVGSHDMQAIHVKGYLEKFPTIRSVCIAGFGEPFMNPQLPEILDVVGDKFVGLITNGSLLAASMSWLKGKSLGYVSVSLNASNAAQHKLATGSDSWDIVLDGIRSALAAGLNCGISAVISRANVGEIPAIIDFAGELGVKFVNLVNLLPHDDPGFLENVITNRSVDALASIEAAKTHLGSDVVKVWPMPVDIDGTNPMRCLSPFQRLGIDVKGNITGCCRVAPPKPENGSVQWEDVWNLPYLVNLRLALTGDRPLPDKCKYCFGNWVG